MGIPGLVSAIGAGERIALSKLAVSHLERESRPIRIAVDISIWLFQVQASRGGRNPELRTLFYRLLKLLALPIHPLFVYDGRQKPPFKRGKSTRGHGNAPIIQRSKDLISHFKFPWHVAPGEAEAECARLQEAGVVDAVMSNDVDTLMFGSTFMIKSFSKESGTGSGAATHVTRYNTNTDNQFYSPNVPFNRAGMILIAMLSGGDYLPSGVPKCGNKLAAEIAKAGFGEDLLEIITSRSPDMESELNDWRDRLQFELEENESGYFTTKHKAVRIPKTFPDQTILQYYAEPIVSNKDGMETLRRSLRHAWDQDIDPLAIRSFAAEHFEWKYRSGARKVIRNLSEPLLSYRLRLQRPVLDLTNGTLAPDCDTPWLQKFYRSRANFGTDGMTELQTDFLPIDVVGIDLLAETPNPQAVPEIEPSQDMVDPVEQEDDPEAADELVPPSPSKSRVTPRYDPMAVQKIWIFETIAKLGVPDIVKSWEDEQTKKANNKAAPKKTTSRRTGPKKKGPIDPGMKRGSILKYGTLTKEKHELSPPVKTRLLEAAMPSTTAKNETSDFPNGSSSTESIDLEEYNSSPSMYPEQRDLRYGVLSSQEVDDLVGTFSNSCTISPTPTAKCHPLATRGSVRARASVLATGEAVFDEVFSPVVDTSVSPAPRRRRVIKMDHLAAKPEYKNNRLAHPAPSPKMSNNREKKANEVEDLEKAISSLSLTVTHRDEHLEKPPRGRSQRPSATDQAKDKQNKSIPSLGKLDYLVPSGETSTRRSPCTSRSRHKVLLKNNDHKESPPSPTQSCEEPEKEPKYSKKHAESSELKQTTGHADSIRTFNGFWCEVDELTESFRECTTEGEKKKKRPPRISIVDMI
ncbi:hypothetical protein N7532_004081 [Penicillium argentinense]|uniref:XPG-I domain-containing protein n=1 Tax=Penicillium argentinense TaxID=1131581 RepID=A0A9W9FP86_9EURO|nr:uncharacterized protein N7532_004081 [Penicillium argentinense]KAJ5103552.1 hypothetical protein N7532_004081 [Penicillium argentinense]